MKRLVKFEMEDGTSMYLEVDEREERGGIERVGGDEEEGKQQREGGRFEAALARIKPAAQAVVNAFREVNTPDEIALELALTFNTKVGAFVFSSDTEAVFKVSLTWKNREVPDSNGPPS